MRMRSDRPPALLIFHVDRCMTWRQVKKVGSSPFSIPAWPTSHYSFGHCSHASQTHHLKRLFYLISFHQLLGGIVDVMETFQYTGVTDGSQIPRPLGHNFQIPHLGFLASSIFPSLTDIDMSLIFFVDRLWLLEGMLSRRWKLCTVGFPVHATF